MKFVNNTSTEFIILKQTPMSIEPIIIDKRQENPPYRHNVTNQPTMYLHQVALHILFNRTSKRNLEKCQTEIGNEWNGSIRLHLFVETSIIRKFTAKQNRISVIQIYIPNAYLDNFRYAKR